MFSHIVNCHRAISSRAKYIVKKYPFEHKDIPYQDDCQLFSRTNYEAIAWLEQRSLGEPPEWLIAQTACLLEAVYEEQRVDEKRARDH